MKKYALCEILDNNIIGTDIYNLVIKNREIAQISKPGQFLELYVNNNKNLLPRPISICNVERDSGKIRLVYQVKGDGTKYFSGLKIGDKIKILGPLGNGFSFVKKEKIAIIGGGIGIPPLMQLTKQVVEESAGSSIDIFLGYRDETFLDNEFKLIRSGYNDVKVYVSTESGIEGFRGNVLDNIKSLDKQFDIIYACGPKPMLKAISKFAEETNCICQVSCEERMACGFGVCVGCVIKIKNGNDFIYKKVCKDGPVFEGKEVVWDE